MLTMSHRDLFSEVEKLAIHRHPSVLRQDLPHRPLSSSERDSSDSNNNRSNCSSSNRHLEIQLGHLYPLKHKNSLKDVLLIRCRGTSRSGCFLHSTLASSRPCFPIIRLDLGRPTLRSPKFPCDAGPTCRSSVHFWRGMSSRHPRVGTSASTARSGLADPVRSGSTRTRTRASVRSSAARKDVDVSSLCRVTCVVTCVCIGWVVCVPSTLSLTRSRSTNSRMSRMSRTSSRTLLFLIASCPSSFLLLFSFVSLFPL